MRQILSWIDEAILIDTLPKTWEILEEEGITGAIDLAWYWQGINQDNESGKTLRDHIAKLAQKANVAESTLLAVIQRLSQDTQVRYVWALYNSFTDFAPDDGAVDVSPTRASAI